MNDLHDCLRQFNVYELFALRRSIHADLERRSRLNGPALLHLPAARNSQTARQRVRISATKDRDCVPAHFVRDASAKETTSDCDRRRDAEKARLSAGRAGPVPARASHLGPVRDVPRPPSAFPRLRR
jgi:hypothetical protein